MDTQALQDKVNQLTTQVSTDESTLAADQAALKTAQDELAQVTLINQLEALDEAAVNTINQALANDPQNSTKISLVLPPPSPAA